MIRWRTRKPRDSILSIGHGWVALATLSAFGYRTSTTIVVNEASFMRAIRARLIPVDGGPAIELVKDLTLVGRGDDCDLRIDHKSVSKRHCVLVRTDGLVLVRDLGSTNGTRVNGLRVRRASLLPNDTFAAATFRYVVKFGDGVGVPADSSASLAVGSENEDNDNDNDGSNVKAPPVRLKRNDLPDTYPEEAE